jgi:hypothetical protein
MLEFDRAHLSSDASCLYLGDGEPGGKAAGLAFIREALVGRFPQGQFQDIRIDIPRMAVLRTGIFEEFISSNSLEPEELQELSDGQIARHFQRSALPTFMLGDLQALISSIHTPLAVRSSSLLEDTMYEPFAGVYATKMIPNNQLDSDSRFRKLVEAMKLVYASTYFRKARDYCRATGHDIREERMGIIVQEVVGYRFRERFYPTISGVARSYTVYPFGSCCREDGVVQLALGLGKTIVDGHASWSYCPAAPRTPPPYDTLKQLLKCTQTRYWAVNLGQPAEYDPTRENEYLIQGHLAEAEAEGSLGYVCSSLDPGSDRLRMGLCGRGPRLVDFSPCLQGEAVELNELVLRLLELAKEKLGSEVEIEFALAFDPLKNRPARFGFLQVRPMVVRSGKVDLDLEGVAENRIVARSSSVLGQGKIEGVRHILYVKPQSFAAEATASIAKEIEQINARLLACGTPYVLIGFGRWGSADPWLGIPVSWSQICAARAIVEGTLPQMNPDLSQGSHFFHNLSSLGVPYFSIPDADRQGIAWRFLESLPAVEERRYTRLVASPAALQILVDGAKGAGVILR